MSDPDGWQYALERIEQEKNSQTGSLSLGGLKLTELPDQLWELTNLSSLGLSSNSLTSLPNLLDHLPDLSYLGLSYNQLSSLPNSLGNLFHLSALYLSNNRLTSLPDSIGQLTNLSSLSLNNNQLTSLPDWLDNLSQLSSLYLWDNQLTTLPDSLGNLSHLSSLSLNNNQLTSLPDSIGQLTNLSYLDLISNQLTTLPNSLGQLINLTNLNLSNNQLTTLPNSLGQLINLTSLNLSDNQLTTLPDSLGQLAYLSSLDLTSNQLTQLPESLGQLANLSSLDLTSNQLTELPESLGQLANLSQLNLTSNQITQLPEFIGQLTNLSLLDLTSNPITHLPESLGQLTNLSLLDLSNTQLAFLPESLTKLTNISSLTLSFNQLTTLPDWLGNLAQLSSLNLRNNQLGRLPRWLRHLPLKQLDLRDNPLPLAPELLGGKDGPAPLQLVLDSYFGACQPLHEAKLLLIGEGEVGKTSVIRRLVYGVFDDQQGKTDGIDVHRWALPVDDHEVQMNIWDFGGQEIYRSTHQFFFTKRSVYVVVISGRQDDSKVLEKWLKTVQQLAGEEAPIVVVVNKIDEHFPQLDERGLKVKYPQVAGFVYLSCKENYTITKQQKEEGVGVLAQLIQQTITTLPHVNDLLHEAWWKVKNSLQNTSYDVMDYGKFVEICEENLVKTEYTQKFLAQLLHDLGVVVHFQDNQLLENIGILNPEWVTQGVYAILNSEKIKGQQGQLSLEDLRGVLDKEKYPPRRYPYLIELMKKFRLCFNLPSRDNCYLIPALFSPEQPAFEWPFASSLALEYQYEDFLPDTVVLWLMVQSYEKLDLSRTWRTGFVLQAKEGQEVVNEALVMGDEANRKLSIWVTGRENTRRGLLAVLRDRLVDIHGRFQRLPFQEMCPAVNVEGQVVGLIDYKNLLWLESRNVQVYLEASLRADIDVRASLNLVEEPEQRVMVELRDYLIERYNLGELKDLTMDLGVDVEVEISMQQSYRGIVQDLVRYANQNGWLGGLRSAAYGGRGGR